MLLARLAKLALPTISVDNSVRNVWAGRLTRRRDRAICKLAQKQQFPAKIFRLIKQQLVSDSRKSFRKLSVLNQYTGTHT